MAKKKMVKDGDDKYVSKNEKYQRSRAKKALKEMKTAGVATELKKSQKQMGYGKLPKVKPSRKGK